MQNIGGVTLGANRSVQVIKVGERILVVGVGETIQLLKEVDEQKEIEELLNQREEQFDKLEQPVNQLREWLKQKLRKEPGHRFDSMTKTSHSQFQSLLEEQLSDVSKSQRDIHDAVRERKGK